MRRILAIALVSLLVGCATRTTVSPYVEDRAQRAGGARVGMSRLYIYRASPVFPGFGTVQVTISGDRKSAALKVETFTVADLPPGTHTVKAQSASENVGELKVTTHAGQDSFVVLHTWTRLQEIEGEAGRAAIHKGRMVALE